MLTFTLGHPQLDGSSTPTPTPTPTRLGRYANSKLLPEPRLMRPTLFTSPSVYFTHDYHPVQELAAHIGTTAENATISMCRNLVNKRLDQVTIVALRATVRRGYGLAAEVQRLRCGAKGAAARGPMYPRLPLGCTSHRAHVSSACSSRRERRARSRVQQTFGWPRNAWADRSVRFGKKEWKCGRNGIDNVQRRMCDTDVAVAAVIFTA
jgi:hypothetical protein